MSGRIDPWEGLRKQVLPLPIIRGGIDAKTDTQVMTMRVDFGIAYRVTRTMLEVAPSAEEWIENEIMQSFRRYLNGPNIEDLTRRARRQLELADVLLENPYQAGFDPIEARGFVQDAMELLREALEHLARPERCLGVMTDAEWQAYQENESMDDPGE